MISAHRISKSRIKSSLSFLIVALMFAACTAESSIDPPTVTSPSPTTTIPTNENTIVEVTPEIATPAPTEVNNSEETAVLLVQEKVRELEGYDESVSIEVLPKNPIDSLPGLRFYSATPMVFDVSDKRCAVYEEAVWCFQEALENIVKQYSLGTNPEQLSDDEWLALVAFFTTTPLQSVNDLGNDADIIPVSEREKISEPVISRPASGGIEISFYFKTEDMMGFGDLSLNMVDISVTVDNATSIAFREIWSSFD